MEVTGYSESDESRQLFLRCEFKGFLPFYTSAHSYIGSQVTEYRGDGVPARHVRFSLGDNAVESSVLLWIPASEMTDCSVGHLVNLHRSVKHIVCSNIHQFVRDSIMSRMETLS